MLGFHRPRRGAIVWVSAWREWPPEKGGKGATPARKGEKIPIITAKCQTRGGELRGEETVRGDTRVSLSLPGTHSEQKDAQ